MKQNTINKESGNVLFLILIAVALFAALSYAVTSSTNSGGGNANDESNLVNSAAVTQYPASVKTAIIRMQVTNGINDVETVFDKPPFTGLSGTSAAVFHPDGGSATYSDASASVMADGNPGEWTFNMDQEVVNISTTAAGTDGNEVIAFLSGITSSICDRLNTELGIPTGQYTASTLSIADNMEEGDTPVAAVNTIGGGANDSGLAGQPYGCFQNGGNTTQPYVYYHVLLQR